MINLQQADSEVEEIYTLIKQHKDGILLDDIAAMYPPKDPTASYSVATLLADCRVKKVLHNNKLYCVAVEKSTEKSSAISDEKDTNILKENNSCKYNM